MKTEFVDKRGLTRDEIYYVLRFNGLGLKGMKYTSANMISVLELAGIDWGKKDKATAECPECECKFDPKRYDGSVGRDKKYCSEICRKKASGVKILNYEPRPCLVCGVHFKIEKSGSGRATKYCSIQCKEKAKEENKIIYFKSDKYLNKRKAYLEKRYQKSRLETQTRTRVCKNCGSNYQRVNTWYCSDECKKEAKINHNKIYSNMDHVKQRRKLYENSRDQRDKKNAFNRKRNKERRLEDPLYVMKERIRNRTKAAFLGQGFTKGCKTREMIGCTWEFFKAHIESQFTKGMKWSNRELWHIDHIIPLASANSAEELEKLSHFSNLRPLWAVDNNEKGDKIIECQPELLIKL